MRKVIFGGANSLDNFIARPDGAVDWLMWGDEAAEVMKDHWSRFGAILMGRKTYEVAMKNAPKSESNADGNPYGGMKSYVFSRSLRQEDHAGVEIVSDNAAGFVRELKRLDGKDICLMGGGELARPIFEAGLIDEIGFNIHPVLLGSGVPLFHEMKKQIDLELIECKPFQNGCVYVLYKVKN